MQFQFFFKAALIRRFDKKSVIREYPIRDFEINIVQNSFRDASTRVDTNDISIVASGSQDSFTTTTVSDSDS